MASIVLFLITVLILTAFLKFIGHIFRSMVKSAVRVGMEEARKQQSTFADHDTRRTEANCPDRW